MKNCSIDLVSYSGFFTINNKQNQKYRAPFIPIQKTVFLKNSLIPAKMIIWSFQNSSGKKVKKIKSLKNEGVKKCEEGKIKEAELIFKKAIKIISFTRLK